jgi:hypothetical protein
MISLFRAALEVQHFLQQQRWQFSYIGGLALQRWGEPRLTGDIDITLMAGSGNEAKYVDVLAARYVFRIKDGKEFALKNRVLLLATSEGIGIDIALASQSYEQRLIERSTSYPFLPDCSIITCSAEDLVISKAFADRDQDWIDIRGILIRQEGRLHWPLMQEELKPLLAAKESPQILLRLLQLRDNIAA